MQRISDNIFLLNPADLYLKPLILLCRGFLQEKDRNSSMENRESRENIDRFMEEQRKRIEELEQEKAALKEALIAAEEQTAPISPRHPGYI